MAKVGRFRKARESAQEHAPGSDFNYARKVWKIGQNRYRIVGDIELCWVIWIDAINEGGRKPIFCHGPDADSILYFKDDECKEPTGEPAPHYLCKMIARMMVSADPAVKALGEKMEPQPVYYANCIDLDDEQFHEQTSHTKLVANNDRSNSFSMGIANDIDDQMSIQGGGEDSPADYETHQGKGLIFVTVKKVKGQNTKYSTTAVLADRPLTEAELAYERYDIEEVASLTPNGKIVEWLGENFLRQHGVTQEEMDAQAPWSPERGKDDVNQTAADGGDAPVAETPGANPTPPADEPAEPSPAEPSPSEPAEPSPAEPTDPAQQTVVGPEGDHLPPGVRWKAGGSGKPFYWHVSDTNKTGWAPGDVVPQ